MKMKSKNFRYGINNANGNDFAHLGKMGKGMFFSLIMLALALVACDRDEVFEKEQYKNVFALISENDNVSRKFHLLGKESVGYIAASLGGTNPTTKNIVVKMVEDPYYLNAFNKMNFDVDKAKYVLPMPESNYDIENFEFTIPDGEIRGRLPIRVRPDGLSPDHEYGIPLRVESHSAYEVNPDKSYIIYSVRIKNRWAAGDGNTVYNMNARMSEKGETYELQMPGTKVMHPITENQVRIMAGNETYEAIASTFNKFAILLTIDEDNRVAISPYKNIEVTQMDGDPFYNNTFFIEDDGFQTYKTFRLRYEYKSDNKIYEFKEELRLQFNPNEESEEFD